MAQPAATGAASTSAAPPVLLSTSSPSNQDRNEAKTHACPSYSALSSDTEQKPQNVAAESPSAKAEPPTDSLEATVNVRAAKIAKLLSTQAVMIDCTTQEQEEVRKMQQLALAQQPVQQFQAMTQELEAPSRFAMKPSSTISSSPTIITPSVVGLVKTTNDLPKHQSEQLTKLQQNAPRQAQSVQPQSNEEWLRNKFLLEQEKPMLLKLQTQQQDGHSGNTATATLIADKLLTQQQQVLRQQQLFRSMLQKQQDQQKAQLHFKMQLQKGGNTVPPLMPRITGKKSTTTATTTYYSMKKRKLKSAVDMELELLAKVCIRVASARTDCEMRQALDKMASWLHRCPKVILLQIAERDYRDSIAYRRPMLMQQNRWPLDLQVKSEWITQKIESLLAVSLLREQKKDAREKTVKKEATVNSAVGTFAVARHNELKGVFATTIKSAALETIPLSTNKATVEREYAEVKAQLQSRQIEMNQKAKAKRDAAKLEASNVVDSAATAAMAGTCYKRPLQFQGSDSFQKSPISSIQTVTTSVTSMYRPPSTTTIPPISPQVAQHLYDLDLSPRATSEPDDKMYLPSRIVSKIMYNALPRASDPRGASQNIQSAQGCNAQEDHDSFQDSITISDDAVTFMQECVTEFLLYFTSEARDVSVLQNRKTKKGIGLSISGTHIVESMDNLGLTSYAQVLSKYNEKVKEFQEAAARRKIERKKMTQLQRATAAVNAMTAERFGVYGHIGANSKPMLLDNTQKGNGPLISHSDVMTGSKPTALGSTVLSVTTTPTTSKITIPTTEE
ncbi:hypothetical protein CCR75_008597 [Bremia lactucae]|uniref:Transcription factor CBF/NF-Y/archaeal histone domain-containing protein n=1 Tax=Bremia lactucae TaxID=4779 RepID=A0A976FIL9_BRELC|nr:hypothetical protein CCR75_008597 [Bremia lactucae]